jgi:hypothetical protein
VDAQHGKQRSSSRHPLICGVVAAGVLCLGWLLPSAHAEEDTGGAGSTVSPVAPLSPGEHQQR